LGRSNDRAWRALEVALAGEGLWDRCKLVLAAGDEEAFREQVRPFLDTCSLAELQGRDAYRQSCLNELRAARKAGVLTEGRLEPRSLARQCGRQRGGRAGAAQRGPAGRGVCAIQ